MRYLAAPVNQNYTDQNGQVQSHPSDKFRYLYIIPGSAFSCTHSNTPLCAFLNHLILAAIPVIKLSNQFNLFRTRCVNFETARHLSLCVLQNIHTHQMLFQYKIHVNSYSYPLILFHPDIYFYFKQFSSEWQQGKCIFLVTSHKMY